MMTRVCTLFCLVAFGLDLAAKEPNILFAFADDWGRQAGIYAKVDGAGTINDVTRTPNFDRLAQRGGTVYQRIGQCALVHAVSELDFVRAKFLGNWSRRDIARSGLGRDHSHMAATVA